MKKRYIKYFMLSILLVVWNCATPRIDRPADEHVYRFVRDNVFYSTSNPSIEIAVNPEFQYIGEAKTSRTVHYKRGEGKGTVHDHSFMFVHTDRDKRIQEGVIISISTIDHGYILKNLFAGIESYLDEGYVRINGENYQYNINASPEELRNYEVSFLVNKGYKIPHCMLMRGIGKRVEPDNRTKIHIFYIENAAIGVKKNYRCQDWNKANSLTKEQNLHIRKFIARSDAGFQIKGTFALGERLKSFLFQYCKAYKEKDADRLSAFFASDAVEKGQTIDSHLSKYRQNFKQIGSLDYLIELKHHSVQNETGIIQVEGTYHARAMLKKNGKWLQNSGKISMELAASVDSFKIKRLDYFIQNDQPIASDTLEAPEPAFSSNPASSASATGQESKQTNKYTIQVASSKDLAASNELVSSLKGKGYPAYLTKVQLSGNIWYRIFAGDFENRHDMLETLDRLQNDKFEGIMVKQSNEPKDIPPETTQVLHPADLLEKMMEVAHPASTLTSSQPRAGIEATNYGVAEKNMSISQQNLRYRLETFFLAYCQTYTEKQLDKFITFFTPDAIDKGKSFQSQIPKYREYFDKIDSLSYWIELKRYSTPQHTGIIQIEGTFNLQVQFKNEKNKLEYSSGDISMDLVASGDSFKIRRLDYYLR